MPFKSRLLSFCGMLYAWIWHSLLCKAIISRPLLSLSLSCITWPSRTLLVPRVFVSLLINGNSFLEAFRRILHRWMKINLVYTLTVYLFIHHFSEPVSSGREFKTLLRISDIKIDCSNVNLLKKEKTWCHKIIKDAQRQETLVKFFLISESSITTLWHYLIKFPNLLVHSNIS